ncbi:MAG: beta-ketoacyl-[acyl-carrier-protein] synthase family protein [Candidatus Omnitrophica bacterium]|nr:beta-ketoacyl-[acyl-carrier-protein] synthase family protein [Candidatus Omnitrophota bacterium]
MSGVRVVVTACDVISAFGKGIDPLWQGLLHKRSMVGPSARLEAARFKHPPAAECPLVDHRRHESVVWQLCRHLLEGVDPGTIGQDAQVYLATTVGEIGLLERALERGEDCSLSNPSRLLRKVRALLGCEQHPAAVLSAACASGSAALAVAAQHIRLGRTRSAVVVACDSVSEFVTAGFSCLMALDASGARPFDAGRAGLSLGDGAGFMVLMDERLAAEKGCAPLAELAGYGLSDDANHITGPSRDGAGLAEALRQALRTAGTAAGDVACISAHGTGTVYNDAMEMKAFKSIFSAPVPVYGIKGAIGHTLAAAGLIECALAIRVLQERRIPPVAGLQREDETARGWVHRESVPVGRGAALCVNAGFGGINAALCIKGEEDKTKKGE